MARRKTSIKRARTAPSVVPALFDPDAAATGEGLFGLDTAAQVARVVVIPVPFDATTSYRAGTANGPAAMLQASKQVDLQDLQFGGVWKAGIAMLPIPKRIAALSRTARSAALPILQAGGARAGNAVHAKALAIVNAASETVHAYVREAAKGILARGAIPALLGGDHASPYALIAELSRKHSGMGILQIDAHADLRQRFEGFTWSHASIFHNVLTRLPGVARLTQVGIRDIAASEIAFINNSKGRVKTFFEQQMRDQQFAGGARGTWGALCKQIVATLPKMCISPSILMDLHASIAQTLVRLCLAVFHSPRPATC